MTTYMAQGRSVIQAESATEFVQKLHKESHVPSATDQLFMDQVARQCLLQDGSIIRSDTAESFLADLIASKFVDVLPEGE
jgi:hypothetical protein